MLKEIAGQLSTIAERLRTETASSLTDDELTDELRNRGLDDIVIDRLKENGYVVTKKEIDLETTRELLELMDVGNILGWIGEKDHLRSSDAPENLQPTDDEMIDILREKELYRDPDAIDANHPVVATACEVAFCANPFDLGVRIDALRREFELRNVHNRALLDQRDELT